MKLTVKEIDELHGIYFAGEDVRLSDKLVNKFVGYGMVKVVDTADGNLAFLTDTGRRALKGQQHDN